MLTSFISFSSFKLSHLSSLIASTSSLVMCHDVWNSSTSDPEQRQAKYQWEYHTLA